MSKLYQYDKAGLFTASVDRVIDQVKSASAGKIVYAVQEGVEAAPESRPGKIAKINATGDGWDYVTDKRGESWWTKEKGVYIVTEPGEPEGQPYDDEKPLVNDGSDEEPAWREKTDEELLYAAKQAGIKQAQVFYNRIMLAAAGNAPDAEMKGWPLQEKWARDYVANRSERSSELLKQLWTDKHRKRDNKEAAALMKFAKVIIAKANRISQLTALLSGQLNTARDAIAVAKVQSEIDAALTKQRTETEAILAAAK